MTDFSKLLSADAPSLLIGGHAVMLHGYPRSTVDFDLLIPEKSESRWREKLEKEGWRLVHATEAFLQFEGPEDAPPFDLMKVDAATFEKLESASEDSTLFGCPVRIPSPEHLVALKLHAVRQEGRVRKEQDWADVIGLIRSCGLDLENRDFHALIERYGGPDAITSIRRRLRGA